MNKSLEVVRNVSLVDRIVIVDGQSGCGKSVFSPIISSLDRVELLNFAYEIEYVCSLSYLQRIDEDVAKTLIRLFADLRLYNLMMSRDTNFRIEDQSSVFKDAKPLRYLARLFQKGNEAALERIKQKRPILHLITHGLLSRSEPLCAAFGKKLVFIEVVRHPLYALTAESHSMKSLYLSDVRHFGIYFSYKGKELPFFVRGWEDLFFRSNHVERAIYLIAQMSKDTELFKKNLEEKLQGAQLITIPFERFVINPWPYMEQMENILQTRTTLVTRRVMKRHKVPRKMYADGIGKSAIGLKAYDRPGWEPAVSSSEEHEFAIRRQFAQKYASKEAMQILDRISAEYEEKYLG